MAHPLPYLPHRQRQKRRYNGWASITLKLQQQLTQYSGLHQKHRSATRNLVLNRVQQRVDDSWQLHSCCQLPDGSCSAASMTVQPLVEAVTFWSMTCHGELRLPSWYCSSCQTSITPTPVPAGCWPSSPVHAAAWFEIDLLETFMRLSLDGGVSCSGLCANVSLWVSGASQLSRCAVGDM